MAQVQVRFNRVNPCAPAHVLGTDEVATATNVDFGLGRGGLSARRGSTTLGTVTSGRQITTLFRNYNLPDNIGANPIYAGDDTGTIYRGTGPTWTQVANGAGAFVGINSFNQYAIICNGGANVKDDGTHTTDWIKQSPGKPTITINTLTPLDLTNGGATSFSVTQGVHVGGSSTCTAVSDSITNTIVFQLVLDAGSPVDLTTNAGNVIGNFGVHFIDLAFSDPTIVTQLSQDYSIGDSTFYNYWHGAILPQNTLISTSGLDPSTLINAQVNVGTGTVPLTQQQRQNMVSSIEAFGNNSLAAVTQLGTNFSPWPVARPDFQFVGAQATSDWSQIVVINYTIQCSGTCTATIRTPQILGAENFCLNDISAGYTWWQTWATLDSNGVKYGESGPGPSSDLFTVQNANATVVQPDTPTGSHGITHTITYRQGGFTQDAYAVSTVALAIATITDTLNDIQALSLDFIMPRNVTTRGNFPGDIDVIAEPFQARVFAAHDNQLLWTLPGQIDTYPATSYAQVSSIGDNIKALVAWTPGLIVINQYSVYELTGNDFEAGDFLLQRSGSRHGSIAPRVAIKTPHGIPLLSFDGLTLYIPGSANEQEIPWLINTYGDMFKGGLSTDPAGLLGDRIPAINRSTIINSCAAYADQRLYLAAPTANDSFAHTMYVIDFNTQQVWWYTYNFAILSLFWDVQDSRLLAGTDDGRIVILERGTTDDGQPVTWNAQTRSWSANSDTVLENLSLEADTQFVQVRSTYDTSNTTVVSTLSNTTRNWTTPSLQGTFVNDVNFSFLGTGTGSIYQMSFDLLSEPVRVFYYRTPYDTKGYEGDKLWDVAYADIENRGTASGNVLMVSMIDGTAVMTNTITAPWSGRKVFEFAFPPEIYGRVAFTTYTSLSTAVQFQHWDSYFDARQEPPKINYYRTDIESSEENIFDAYDVDINPNGTVTGTAYLDNNIVVIGTFTGSHRQSYTFTIPPESYGRTIYVAYTGVAFKHYKTWYHQRREPDRWSTYVSDRRSEEEEIWDAFECDINPLGNTVLATFVLDGIALTTSTLTGTERHSFVSTIPVNSYGRTARVIYASSGGLFKHFNTWYSSRKEPNRITSYVTPKFTTDEHEWKIWKPELDTEGGLVTSTVFVEGFAVATYTNFSSDRHQFINSLPVRTFGRTIYAELHGTAPFKIYPSGINSYYGQSGYGLPGEWEGVAEPARVTLHRHGPMPFPSSNYLKTWLPELDPCGGAVVGTLIVDDNVLTSSTFSGDRKQWFTVGLDISASNAIQTGSRWEVIYSGLFGGTFKHYDTKMESEPKPFGKTVWAYSYRKIGGASQVDVGRYFSVEIEAQNPCQVQYWWDNDGNNFTTGTLTLSGGIEWFDRIPLPPGMRGYLFLFRLQAGSVPVKIYKVNLDLMQEGIKHLVRRTVEGNPQNPGGQNE